MVYFLIFMTRRYLPLLLTDRFGRRSINAKVVHSVRKYEDTTHASSDNFIVEVSTIDKPNRYIQLLFHVSECQADELICHISEFLDIH